MGETNLIEASANSGAEIKITVNGDRVSEHNKLVTEMMSLKLDDGSELKFTTRYDPGSLLDSRHVVELEHNGKPLGKITWEFELESFLARLLKVWGVYYSVQAVMLPPPVLPDQPLTQLEEIHKPEEDG